MNPSAQAVARPNYAEIFAVLVRWSMGILFLYMGLNKAMDPVDFLKLVREYHIVDSPLLLNTIAATLPWFEVFCAVLLILGVAVRGVAVVLLGMLIPFTILVLKRALDIHAAQGGAFCGIRFNCGCGAGEVYICNKMLENTLLILFSGWLLSGRGRFWSTRYNLLGE